MDGTGRSRRFASMKADGSMPGEIAWTSSPSSLKAKQPSAQKRHQIAPVAGTGDRIARSG
jgi:hypothetical protein